MFLRFSLKALDLEDISNTQGINNNNNNNNSNDNSNNNNNINKSFFLIIKIYLTLKCVQNLQK